MKIMNTLTLRYLKANKKRSLLTLLCIMVSVIMMSCVGFVYSSGKAYYQEYIEKTEGDYHYYIDTYSQETLDLIKKDSLVQEYYCASRKYLSYHEQELLMKTADSLNFQKRNMHDYIIEGRLPVNQNEIVITPAYLKVDNLNKTIGDTIQFDNQETYTIVGIMDAYTSYEVFNETYQAISYIDLEEDYTIYVKDKHLSHKIVDHLDQLKKQISSEDMIMPHTSYLAIQNIEISYDRSSIFDVYLMVYTLIVIIMIVSIMIIYQAIQLSTGDRMQYLAMLSSVGATTKQKARSIYFEGLTLSIIGIPLGMLLSYGIVHISTFYINQMQSIKNLSLTLQIKISPLYFLMIIIFSSLTIFMGLYVSARRLSKISIMDALNKVDEVKAYKESMKLPFLIRSHVSISTQMAIKNYKRQGIKSRAMVFSLTVSIIILVCMYSFSQTIFFVLRDAYSSKDYDVRVDIRTWEEFDNLKNILNENYMVNDYIIDGGASGSIRADVDANYLEIPLPPDEISISIKCIDNAHFQKICKDNNIEYVENMALVNNIHYNVRDSNFEIKKTYDKTYKKMDENFVTNIYIIDEILENDEYIEVSKKLEDFSQIKMIDSRQYDDMIGALDLLVSEDYLKNYISNIYFVVGIQTNYHKELANELQSSHFDVSDEAEIDAKKLQIVNIAEISTYIFVSIMVTFSFLNIINMMSASVERRRKEFAMLMSVGMTSRDITKMLWKESIIYGIKAFVYSLPFCIVIEYILYGMAFSTEPFMPSFITYILTFLLIITVMMIAFKVGLNRFKKQNIIETLKDDI